MEDRYTVSLAKQSDHNYNINYAQHKVRYWKKRENLTPEEFASRKVYKYQQGRGGK